MLRVQQLTELEEILAVKRAEASEAEAGGVLSAGYLSGTDGGAAAAKALMQAMWNGRLRGVQRNVEVWQALLRWGEPRGAGVSVCGFLGGEADGVCVHMSWA